jgi:hypothetical protein
MVVCSVSESERKCTRMKTTSSVGVPSSFDLDGLDGLVLLGQFGRVIPLLVFFFPLFYFRNRINILSNVYI